MMENSMTPQRIANSILQDRDFTGHYVLVEGKKDIRLYNRFINSEFAKVKPTFGKYKLREAYKILSEQGFDKKIGIRDADFLRIKGNPKFDATYSENIFATDYHDAEVMMIKNDALQNFLFTVSDQAKISAFEKEKGIKIEAALLSLAYNLGCLKLANKRFTLGLFFKPEKEDGKRLKFEKFICDKHFTFLGNEKLINTVWEYSSLREKLAYSRQYIQEKLDTVLKECHEPSEIVNGHDLSEILLMLSSKGLKSSNKALQNSDCVEDMLILAFDLIQFSKTALFKEINQFGGNSGVQIFKPI